MDAPLIEGHGIPQWCPLPVHPAKLAAEAEYALNEAKKVMTIAVQESQKSNATTDRLREIIDIAVQQLNRTTF